MARFLASIQGSRGEATRLGTPRSGIRASAQGWDVGVTVYGSAYADVDRDEFYLHMTSGSNGRYGSVLLGKVTIADAGDGRPHFYPSEHVRTIMNGEEA